MRYTLLLLIFLSSIPAFSQYSSGFVHNQQGQPVSGALIYIPLTSDSCRTDSSGHFTLYSSANAKQHYSGNRTAILSLSYNAFIIDNSKSQRVSLTAFDLKGRRSAVLFNDILSNGQHQLAMPPFLRNQTFIAVVKAGALKQTLRIAGSHSFSRSGINERALPPAIKAVAPAEFEIRVRHPGYDERIIMSQVNKFNDITIYRKLNMHSNVTIRINDTLSLQSGDITLSLDSVDDQRCDCDVLCAWEGNATIFLTLTINGTAHKVQLETYNKRELDVEEYKISFVSLNACRQENPANYQLLFSFSLMKSVLFIEHFTTTDGTSISGICGGLQIDFPTYHYNQASGVLTTYLNPLVSDSLKLIFGEGVSLQGDAGGGIASGLQNVNSTPFTSSGALRIDSVSTDGKVSITYKGLSIHLASGESWNTDTSYIESDPGCTVNIVKKDRISNFGLIHFSRIVQE